MSALTALCIEATEKQNYTLKIPPLTLGEFAEYTFELSFKNYKDLSGNATAKISTLSTEAPFVNFK